MRTSEKVKKSLVTCSMLIPIFAMLFPLYMLLNNSFKTLRAMTLNALAPAIPPTLNNYIIVLDRVEYLRRILNNFIIVIPSLTLIILLGAMAGFVVARRRSRVTKFIHTYIILGIALPSVVMIYPQIRLIHSLGLMNNYLGMILIFVGSGISMSLFMFNGFFGGAPKELEESAKIDGASFYTTFFKIYFPLSTPTAATVILIQSIGIWNDEQLSNLLMAKTEQRMLLTSLQEFYGAMVGRGIRWEQIYTYAAMCILPMIVMFFIVNRYLISGISEGALKG